MDNILRVKENFKIILTLIYFNILLTPAIGQNSSNMAPCSNVKFDTIRGEIVAELGVATRYYTSHGTRMQDELVFMDKNYNGVSISNAYQSDSVIIPFTYQTYSIVRSTDSCLKLEKISEFDAILKRAFISKKLKRQINRLKFRSVYGPEYIKFTGIFVVINLGSYEWLKPHVFCSSDEVALENRNDVFCHKVFSNTLVLADIIDLKFRTINGKIRDIVK